MKDTDTPYRKRETVDQAFDEMVHAAHLVQAEFNRVVQEFRFPQLSKRLEHLGQQKPVEFALSAFVLGFALGSQARVLSGLGRAPRSEQPTHSTDPKAGFF